MARRRMFSLDVVDTDNFTEMSVSAQVLYFHLGMHGDDDGFVSSPKKIAKSVGCNTDDLKLLVAKGFIIPFDSGVVVIRDWNANNTLRNDRYRPTIYQAEKAAIEVNKFGRYELVSSVSTALQPSGNQMEPQLNLTEPNGTEPRKEIADKPPRPRFTPPSEDEAIDYFDEQGSSAAEAKSFLDYYAANGWKVGGRATMKNWQAAARNWIRRAGQYSHPQTKQVAAEPAIDTISRAAERLASGNFSNLEDAFL